MEPKRTRQKILDFIQACDHSPTVREIAVGTGLTSPGHVYYHLLSLERDGEITRKNGRIVVRP